MMVVLGDMTHRAENSRGEQGQEGVNQNRERGFRHAETLGHCRKAAAGTLSCHLLFFFHP
jgi:hypothetical protein